MFDSPLVKLGSMKMLRRTLVLVLLFLAIGAAFAAYHWMAPRRTPPGQRTLADLTPATLPALRESFNGASGATRDREFEFLRHYQRLSPKAQDEVQEFIQFKLQSEDKVRDEKVKKDN